MRDSFVMYCGYMDQIKLLSMEQRGLLLTCLIEYVSGKELTEMDGMTMMAFSFIKSQIDRDAKKYEEVCQKRSEAGKAGGRPKKANALSEKAKKANGFSEKQTKAKKADNEYEYDNDLKESNLKVTKEKFKPPTVEEVRAYCLERKNSVDPQTFVDFYEASGWMRGKNKIKDWKACVRTWERGRSQTRPEGTAKRGSNSFNNFAGRDYGDMKNLTVMLTE